VVLLHGTVSTPKSNFTPLAARLRSSGHCVYAVLYGAMFGWGGLGDIDVSADQVAAFIEKVRHLSHTDRVDVVAFSQGALVLRDALQRSLDPETVRLAVLLAPNYHGTSVDLVSKVPAAVCASCAEQAADSPLLRRLAQGGELADQVRYASLSTRSDAWVLPVASQAPRGPADRVRSQLLQDACPRVTAGHADLPATPAAITWVLAALQTGGRPPTTFACH
jgi:triacylglycerol esterase/lipase EstA (alpha/beta hydrolase family)